MGKIILFGAGNNAIKCWKQIENNMDCFCDDYLAFCDNSASLWGNFLFDRIIISPQDIDKYGVDFVVITSIYHNEIYKQLVEELSIPETKICTFDEYARKQYSRWMYKKRYGNETKYEINKTKTEKLVVYTAITGSYDNLKDPAFVDKDITYVCFTDNHEIKSNVWNVEYISNTKDSDVLFARYIKSQPHIFFPEFETSVWIDGSFHIIADIREYINKYQKESVMLCFPHYERECIYDEACACIFLKKERIENIMRQINMYYGENYPFNNGLYATGCLVRRHNDDFCKIVMNEWMKQIEKYSLRDQISLPYVFWKNNSQPDICDLNICVNEWLKLERHIS